MKHTDTGTNSWKQLLEKKQDWAEEQGLTQEIGEEGRELDHLSAAQRH